MKTAARWTSRLLDVVLILVVLSVLAIVLAVNFAPALGRQIIVIRGGSMEPSIHLGSAIVVTTVKPTDLRPGDVVTMKDANGTLLSHRITRVVTLPDGLYVETKGDANAAPDPVLVPASEVVGRIDASIPGAGYLIYVLTIPTGVASVLCFALTMLFGIWLLEDLEGESRTEVVLEEYESDLARFLDAQRQGEPMREMIW